MMVLFTSRSEKKAMYTVRQILDAFADRIGNDTWQTCITEEGLLTVKTILKKYATKNMAVSCRWIRSRSRSELLWVVGNRNQFNGEGVVPVNWTGKNLIHQEWENNWQYLSFIQALVALAALFHDWGKANNWFCQKLMKDNKKRTDSKKRKISKKRDPYRHEWVSCRLIQALVQLAGDEVDDTKWLTLLAEGKLDEKAVIKEVNVISDTNQLGILPPLASMLVWLILSHHQLPHIKGKKKDGYADETAMTFSDVLSKTITSEWEYENTTDSLTEKERKQCFSFSKGLLWNEALTWQKWVRKWSGRLLQEREHVTSILPQGEPLLHTKALRMILTTARLGLMIGDHYVSSLDKEPESNQNKWHAKDLIANTDGQGKPKQYLEEHLVRVCKQALQTLYRLPQFATQMERAYDIRVLKKKSPPPFAWQDKAVSKIREFRDIHTEKATWFLVNMASTGCGKTIANAKLMQAISEDGKSLRYILALGLRSLTLQTGDVYQKQLGLDDTELAVLIGSDAVKELHEKSYSEEECGSESAEELLRESLRYVDTFDTEQNKFMDLFLGDGNNKAEKNKALLYKPVLVATIDHMMGAVQTIKGGRYMLPFLRLLSSDLVIDEIDDFNPKDLYAISRLVHLAGMLGRSVGISSATIPPDLAEGLYRAYKAGLLVHNEFFSEKKKCHLCWCDEFKTVTTDIDLGSDSAFMVHHQKFVESRVKKLKQQLVRRKGALVSCDHIGNTKQKEERDVYFEQIRKTAEKLHENNYIIDQKTGKRISFGLIRMANINPCVDLSLYLLSCEWSKEYEVRLMTYHSRQVLLLRHEQEKYLDGMLQRKYAKGKPVDLTDSVLRKHIDHIDAPNVLFLVVSTPVEETGRDHDFDWAIIEPSSYRSIIQLSGRVLRHRKMEGNVTVPNVAIMEYNLRGLQGEKRAFKWPGYEVGKYKLSTHDMKELINEPTLNQSIDAIPRIQKAKTLHPANCLIDLEHKVMEDFNSRTAVGPRSLHGWTEEYWWMTGMMQEFHRFREKAMEDIEAYLVYNKEKECFMQLIDKELVERQKVLGIEMMPALSEIQERRLWLQRDYGSSLSFYLVEDQLNEKDAWIKVALKYGELIIPDGKILWYSDQFGVFKRHGEE